MADETDPKQEKVLVQHTDTAKLFGGDTDQSWTEVVLPGLKDAPWSEFVGLLKEGENETFRGITWDEALSNASSIQLGQAIMELDLSEEKLLYAADSFRQRFSNRESLVAHYGMHMPLQDGEFGYAVDMILRAIEANGSKPKVRSSFLEALKAAAEAWPRHGSLQKSNPLLIAGLSEEPGAAIICAGILGAMKKGKEGKPTCPDDAFLALARGIEREQEVALACLNAMLSIGKGGEGETVFAGMPEYIEIAVPALIKAIERQDPEVALACAEALGSIGRNRGSEQIFAMKAIPALEEFADRMKKNPNRSIRFRALDSIEAIKSGNVRCDTGHYEYLGDGEPLRVSIFANQLAPKDKGKPTKEKRRKNRY